ncbi:hypothetical protein TanjilG_02678 [Lupinus angustifolius]|uniref:Autophagy-related protein n=1 Tax=Lupinus angustifolius TaxID=3871 RepID=A0A4P1RB67_LUPAN|nr:PREDICTED: autophagy-related protein 8i-like [Lupinus angustifolius]OIW07044.1 hypothetical protein TanjilG_02678 [Lupinus angustifolius]
MGGSFNFKDKYTFDQRLEESRYIVAKYPDRVRVIVERYAKSDLPELERKKYLGKLTLPPGKALFVFVKNTLPRNASMMDSVHKSFRDEDGFLYMHYTTENTFGYVHNVKY